MPWASSPRSRAEACANFGTMTKPLHAGAAARDAVTAVALAADGFTANEGLLEAPGGFSRSSASLLRSASRQLPAELERWRLEWPMDWSPALCACYATHRAVDAALSLRARLGGNTPCASRWWWSPAACGRS